jgi:hypothetical protein
MQTLFTRIHVAISLLGIASGLVVMWGLLTGQQLESWVLFFLVTTIATSVTGFPPFFPFTKVLPSHVVAVISLIVLALAVYARYAAGLEGGWRTTFVVCSVLAEYLNVFVLVVQLFQKVPALHALAPKQNEPPFKIAQGLVLLAFVAVGVLATGNFDAAAAASAP